MKASSRVLVNTIAQYIRIIINLCLSLYTVRIILSVLGVRDYGIYTLIAGVIAMLSFITNSLVATTQRFVSFYQGKGDINVLKTIFNNSLVIHLAIGLVFAAILIILTPFLFNGALNIPIERIEAAKQVYFIVIVILFFTIITAPFRAILVSHENIVYISIIDVCDGVLKVITAIALIHISFDKLILYGYMMLAIQLFNFLALSIYSYIKYEECTMLSFRRVSWKYTKELSTFAGWNIYSTGCSVARQQGTAIVINRFLGTAMNAAYGIGFQIAGYSNYLAQALVNAIVPQIVKAEGGGNRQKSLWLSCMACKYVFFLLSLVCIPCIFEIDSILSIWLGDVPDKANLFCIMVMCTLLVDSLSQPLTYINQAIGNIKWYSIIIYTPKLLSLLLFFYILKNGESLVLLASVYVCVEFMCSIIRLPYLHRTAGLEVKFFLEVVTKRELLPVIACVGTCYLCTNLMVFYYRFIVTFILSSIVYIIVFLLYGTTLTEKNILHDALKKTINKIPLKFAGR